MASAVVVEKNAVGKSLTTGMIAGLGGGFVFGVMMAMMDMLPMVAGLVGSQSPVVGGIVHLGISAVIGAIYGVALSPGGFRLSRGFAVVSGVSSLRHHNLLSILIIPRF